MHPAVGGEPALDRPPPLAFPRRSAETARRLELGQPALFQDDEAIARSSLPDDFDWDGLKRQGWLRAPRAAQHPASCGGELRLSTGLKGPQDRRAQDGAGEGRLRLLTTKAHYFVNSTFANMPRQAGQQGGPTLEMHPADAKRLGLEDGTAVVACNGKGSLLASLRITESLVEGTTVLEGKRWWTEGEEGSPVTNRLAHARRTPGGQPTFNDVFVAVGPAG
jgi:anaerobic selenocysteine-containing dehydrogenase